MPTKAVGLLLFTVIDEILYAVCQVRGAFNFQTMRSESWAGLLQPTCHGKLQEGEEYMDALVGRSAKSWARTALFPTSIRNT
jgi:hypothetical protein